MDLDAKPGRRDKKPDGSTHRSAPRMTKNDATLQLVSGDAADDVKYLNLNKHGNWKVAEELQKKEGVTVVKVENAPLIKKKHDPSYKGTPSVKHGGDNAEDDEAAETASGKTKSKKGERKEKMRQKAEEELAAKATETVYVLRCEIPEKDRANHKVLTRDGGAELVGCNCSGCTGYVKGRDKRAESKRELINELTK